MTGRSLNKFAWMEALRGADLTHAEYRVLLNLSTFARADLTNARPGLAKLCAAARVNEKTAKKALRDLVAKGWLEIAERGGNEYGKGKANVYTLTVPKEADEAPLSKRTAECPPSGRKGTSAYRGRGPLSGPPSVE